MFAGRSANMQYTETCASLEDTEAVKPVLKIISPQPIFPGKHICALLQKHETSLNNNMHQPTNGKVKMAASICKHDFLSFLHVMCSVVLSLVV